MSLLERSLTGGGLAVAVILLRALAINHLPKRSFLALWGVVLVRLLLPYSVSLPVSVPLPQPKLPPVVVSVPLPQAPVPAQTVPNVPAAAPAMDAAAGPDLLPLLWAAGALALALFFLVSYGRWRWIFRTSLPVENPFTRTWLAEHPLRRTISVRQSDRIAAPLTYGLLRPVILVPAALDWTDHKTLHYVFAHEYVHIRRFDAAVKLLLAGTLCVHWFNPVVWVMYVLANRDLELSCDEAVVRQFGGGNKSRLEYVLALLAMEEQRSGLGHLNFSKNAMQERITAIMKLKKRTAAAVISACLLVTAATVAFAAAPEEKTPAGPQTQATAVYDPWNVRYQEGKLWFTVPGDGWTASISGRQEVPGFGGMSIHFEFPELKSGKTCSYDVSGGGYTELWLDAHQAGSGTTQNIDLASFLPEELRFLDCSIYEPFGLIRDEKDGKFYFKGEKVRYFYDGVELEDGAAVRREYICDSGTVDIYTVWEPKDNGDGSYDPFGTLADVRAYSQEEFNNRDIVTEDDTILETAITTHTQTLTEGKTFEEIFAQYEAFGITYREGNVYYNGELVNCFADVSNTGVFSYQSKTKGGGVNLRTVYDKAGKLTGVETFTGSLQLTEGGLAWPLSEYRELSQSFTTRVHPVTGREIRHTGLDITAPKNTPVLAAAAGAVTASGYDSKDGNYVLLSHGDGLETYYAHLTESSVKPGDTVTQGQTIGTVGSTGQATGPHLHFEVRQDDVAQDPMGYFAG